MKDDLHLRIVPLSTKINNPILRGGQSKFQSLHREFICTWPVSFSVIKLAIMKAAPLLQQRLTASRVPKQASKAQQARREKWLQIKWFIIAAML
mmetsp:Transcript_2468/g.7409  ORF Transcript_2468/g.7409 Transcript_2468/m.7409 type:complete len:94 (-) Transcript_2468:68-349(-)